MSASVLSDTVALLRANINITPYLGTFVAEPAIFAYIVPESYTPNLSYIVVSDIFASIPFTTKDKQRQKEVYYDVNLVTPKSTFGSEFISTMLSEYIFLCLNNVPITNSFLVNVSGPIGNNTKRFYSKVLTVRAILTT